jgi:hypothetical protein
VRALTRVATDGNEEELLGLARVLTAVAEAALAAPEGSRPGGERYQVVVHVDERVLSDDDAGACELDDGSAVAPETARRIACDASVVRDGSKSRTIPPALRRALRARDGRCRFPGCENRRFLDAHHVHHWSHGGRTILGNLVLLCRRHHRLVHEGGYRVDASGRFFYPWGEPFPAVPALPRGQPSDLLDRNSDLEIDCETCASGTGEQAEIAYVVDAMGVIADETPSPKNSTVASSITTWPTSAVAATMIVPAARRTSRGRASGRAWPSARSRARGRRIRRTAA